MLNYQRVLLVTDKSPKFHQVNPQISQPHLSITFCCLAPNRSSSAVVESLVRPSPRLTRLLSHVILGWVS